MGGERNEALLGFRTNAFLEKPLEYAVPRSIHTEFVYICIITEYYYIFIHFYYYLNIKLLCT